MLGLSFLDRRKDRKTMTAERPPIQVTPPPVQVKPAKLPTKTEADFYAEHDLGRFDARHEGLTFKMANGHRYTPDWTWWGEDGRLNCAECKGSYRLPSYQRAKLAFDQVVVEFPHVVWHWWEKKSTRKRKKK